MEHELFENKFAKFWISDQILFFEYKQDVVIDLAAAQCIVADRIQFQNEISYPIFCDVRGIKNIDKTARDYLAQSGSVLTKAVSFLVDKRVLKAMTTFYVTISKPTVPSQMFDDTTKALEFLSNYS
ncbi:hypothetical protein MKD41_01715 [Lutibacter sp. A64]|uniref:DUF7793 family protein n=1 Tax=Lutibacter sp. A64 TaxID=2918526 RepID=UPI001F05B7F7|nr:hypothetical protein [Lutibacter sp. A64]UMB54208.1 hypothetical protein MKD41_01715 [Lutibacter sp. A64]